jgi:DNA-binding MarR family transcriptional regulator
VHANNLLPAEALQFVLGKVGRQLRAAWRGDPAAIGVLYELSRIGPARLSALANALALDISTTSRHVRTLEADDLIERQADEADGRATLLHVTDGGKEFLTDAIAERSAVLRAATASWSEDDLTELHTYLKRLAEDIGELAGEKPQ